MLTARARRADGRFRQVIDVSLDRVHFDQGAAVTFDGFEPTGADQSIDGRVAATDQLAGVLDGDQERLDLHLRCTDMGHHLVLF
jgi:hypothetical protein